MRSSAFGVKVLIGSLLATLAACESKPSVDECATTVTRLMPVLAKGPDRTIGVDAMQRLIERCKTRTKGSAEDVLFHCVGKAKDEMGIQACMADAVSAVNLFAPPSPASPDSNGSSAKPRSAEAELQLAKIKTNAKAAFNTDSSYPAVTAPLTPATPCCDQPGGRCSPSAANWATPAWQALDFQVEERFDFQYSYTGTATGYTAIAVGDPGCRGKPVTFVLTGSMQNGNPQATFEMR